MDQLPEQTDSQNFSYEQKTMNFNNHSGGRFEEPNISPEPNNKRDVIVLLACLIPALMVVFLFISKFISKLPSGNNGDGGASEAIVTKEPDNDTVTEPIEVTQNTNDDTVAKPLEVTQISDYEVFDTTLIAKVDEAGVLRMRNKPDRDNSEIILEIADGTSVHVLGYKDTGNEIWFKIESGNSTGWVRGGQLQPNNLGMLYDEQYDKPQLDKWKSKFQTQTPNDRSYIGKAIFKGTLYFMPDLSSGVIQRFKSETAVNVYSKNGEWYYVEFENSGVMYYGWVYQSYLSWL